MLGWVGHWAGLELLAGMGWFRALIGFGLAELDIWLGLKVLLGRIFHCDCHMIAFYFWLDW